MVVKNDVLLPHGVRNYLEKHKLDGAIATALEGVLRKMPVDPLGYIAEDLSHRSVASPSWHRIEHDGACDTTDMVFDIYVAVRGVPARMNKMNLGPSLLQDQAAGEAEPAVPARDLAAQARRQRKRERLIGHLERRFEELFGGVSIDEYLGLQQRCLVFLSEVPYIAEVFTRLFEALLISCVWSLDTTKLEFLRRCFVQAEVPHLLAPPLRSDADLPAWRERWPRLALPVLLKKDGDKGALPAEMFRPASLAFAVAMSPFVQDAASETPYFPPFGWLSSAANAATLIGAEALKLMMAEKAPSLAALTRHARKASDNVIGAGCVSQETFGVMMAAAEEAWNHEEGVYELEAGRKLTLEQLVDVYAEAAEGDWLRMILQPFRAEDASVGCELLKGRVPALRLVQDLVDEESPAVKGEAYSRSLQMTGSLPEVLRQYSKAADRWREADGCARCLLVGKDNEYLLPEALDVAMTLAEVEVVFVERGLDEAQTAAATAHADDLLRALPRRAMALWPEGDPMLDE